MDEKKQKQIEEMDAVIRSAVKSHFVQIPQYSKYGGYDGTKEMLTRQIAVELHNAGYRKQEWISVNERLPEDTQMCLAYATVYFVPDHVDDCDHCERIIVTKYYKEFGFMDQDVHYWMPLPEAPKMKGGAE